MGADGDVLRRGAVGLCTVIGTSWPIGRSSMGWVASLTTEGIQVWHPPLGHKSTSLFRLLFPNVTQNVPGGVQAA